MNIAAYLSRLGIEDQMDVTVECLRKIHREHLLHIPFENLDIQKKRALTMDPFKLYDKIVDRKRGGICYELNCLLGHMLLEIGFDVTVLGGKVNGTFFDHYVLKVDCEGEYWLVDVGFGNGFLEPIRFKPDLVQQDVNGDFKFEWITGEEVVLWHRKTGRDQFEFAFTLLDIPRTSEVFLDRMHYYESDPASLFVQKSFTSLERMNGRVSLSRNTLKTTHHGVKTEEPIQSDAQYKRLLRELFAIEQEDDVLDKEKICSKVRKVYGQNPGVLPTAFWKWEKEISLSTTDIGESGGTWYTATDQAALYPDIEQEVTGSEVLPERTVFLIPKRVSEKLVTSDTILNEQYVRTQYFKLTHPLTSVLSVPASEGIEIQNVLGTQCRDVSDFLLKCYPRLRMNEEIVESWRQHTVYDPTLWIWAVDVATDQRIGLGIAEYDPDLRECALEWIQVLPFVQGQGIGKLITLSLLNRVKEKAAFATVAGEVENHTGPERLYRRCGFIGDQIWDMFRQGRSNSLHK